MRLLLLSLAGLLLAASPAAAGGDVHEALFTTERFPSADQCRICHPTHYEQWSVSQHAYAQLSPVFNAMQAKVTELTNGSNGDFCIRCHTPVGMAIGEATLMPNLDRDPVSQEGVTCIVCHRVNEPHGKFSGRTPLVEGGLDEPVFGPRGNEELERALGSEDYALTTSAEGGPGRLVHDRAERFFQLTEPSFCGRCHDVTTVDGFRLEEAFSEYKTSPAASRGDTCQDCHWGKVPGDPDGGYDHGPAAIVGGVPTEPRRLTNHMIVGPDHSVVHPALFPHSPEVRALAELRDWLDFDHEAGWGTDAFEDSVTDDSAFPERWSSPDDRYDARELLDRQEDLLAQAEERRLALLRRGYLLGDVVVDRADERKLKFRVQVRNGIDSHNVPTGFIAERLVFLQVEVFDESGDLVMTSGDLDANGDVRDLHSTLVNSGEVELDDQLFSLQSRFLLKMLSGGEREQVLAVNHSVDALPFVRPETVPTTLTGRPRGARIHKMSIEPNGHRWARYQVGRKQLSGPGTYRVSVKLIAGMVPVNLIHEIQSAGFDYGLTAREIADRILEHHLVLHERELEIEIPGGRG
jgi:nitrate/TMAO reductase-like tetraheme cytochrome c subunit